MKYFGIIQHQNLSATNFCTKVLKPHGGGTFLIKTSLNVKGLFDLSQVSDFKGFKIENNNLFIGSSETYSHAGKWLEKKIPGNYLSKAFLTAASTPLRNRITIGGSLCSSPKWSDLSAPLLCAEAEILVYSSDESSAYTAIPYNEYVSDRQLRQTSLIAKIKIPIKNLKGEYYRFTLTGFDYPLFSIATTLKDGIYQCAVNGAKKSPILFKGEREKIIETAKNTLIFNSERGFTGEYLKQRAIVGISRLLNKAGA